MLLISIWNFFFVIALGLFLTGKINRQRMIIVTLISIIPSLLFFFISLFSFIFRISNIITFALPLVQLGGFFLIRQIEKVRESEKSGEMLGKSSEEVKIPLSYLFRSVFRRGRKDRNWDLDSPTDSDTNELALEDKDK